MKSKVNLQNGFYDTGIFLKSPNIVLTRNRFDSLCCAPKREGLIMESKTSHQFLKEEANIYKLK